MALVPEYPEVVRGITLSSNEVANISSIKTNSVGANSILEDSEMSEGR